MELSINKDKLTTEKIIFSMLKYKTLLGLELSRETVELLFSESI